MSKSDFDILRQQAKDKAEEARERTQNWRPKAGDSIEATVIRGKVVHANDKRTPILIVEEFDTEEKYTIWCGNFMLERAVADLAPAVGSLVVVEFHGSEPTTNDPSRTFNNYTMACSESDPEYWADLERKYQAQRSLGAEAARHNEKAEPFGPDQAPF